MRYPQFIDSWGRVLLYLLHHLAKEAYIIVIGPPQVKRRLLISSVFDAMIFWKCYKLNSNISENCWKFIASKMLELKSPHLT